MAWTKNRTNHCLDLTPDGTNDYDGAGDFPVGCGILKITALAGATNDVLVVRDGSATGPIIFKSIGTRETEDFPGARMTPYVDNDDLTMATAGNCRLLFVFE